LNSSMSAMSHEDEIAGQGGGEDHGVRCMGSVGPEAGGDNNGRGAAGGDGAMAGGAGVGVVASRV
jgi:hypothetical protein